MLRYTMAVLIGIDILINALTGGDAYTTLSARLGKNIEGGGWASKIPWPNWLKRHFLDTRL